MSTGKGQKKYRGMVSDLDKKILIEVVKDRTQEVLIESLMLKPKEVREEVEEVCVKDNVCPRGKFTCIDIWPLLLFLTTAFVWPNWA